jgi:hypothetical protein
MSTVCDAWSEAVNAVDAFERATTIRSRKVVFSFGGITSPRLDDNSDILSSRAVEQEVLDLLDEPPKR